MSWSAHGKTPWSQTMPDGKSDKYAAPEEMESSPFPASDIQVFEFDAHATLATACASAALTLAPTVRAYPGTAPMSGPAATIEGVRGGGDSHSLFVELCPTFQRYNC